MLKKIFTCALMSVASLMAIAQNNTGARESLQIVDNSFIDYAAANRKAGTDMGVTNMTSESIDWPKNADGDDNCALLIVVVENMSRDDLDAVNIELDNGEQVALAQTNTKGNKLTRWFFFPESNGQNVGVTISHPRYGLTKLPGKRFDQKHIYQVTVRNPSTVTLSINSEPTGATVTFDGQPMSLKTPMTIPNVLMGTHTIALTPADAAKANPVKEQTIDVNNSNAAFNFDMMKRKTVTIIADPSDSHLTAKLNDKIVAEGQGRIVLKDVPYERDYTIIGKYKEQELIDKITINEELAPEVKIYVIGSRSVSFTSKQNNQEVKGAQVTINGRDEGQTPMTKVLKYGKYTIGMAYGGYTKNKTFTVGKNSDNCMINIPSKKRVSFNPWNVDFQKRQYGLSVNYVNKYYSAKQGGKSKHYNNIGTEGGNDGVQVGISYQPYFKYGQGLSFGVYAQILMDKEAEIYIENDYRKHTQVDLYIPLQYQFTLPLSRHFSISLNAGAAVSVGVYNGFSMKDENTSVNLGFGYNEEHGMYLPERVDYSLLFGVGIQMNHFKIEAKLAPGLRNHKLGFDSESQSYIEGKSNAFSAGVSFLF